MSAPHAAAGLLSQLNDWDTTAFSALNALHSPFWDSVMAQVSSPWVLVPIHLLLLTALFRRTGWRHGAVLFGLLLLVIAIDLAGARMIKEAVQRIRPCNVADLAAAIHFVGGRRSGAFSFVSTHTTYAVALAAFAFFSLHRRRLALGLALWAAAVGYSRVYVGLHYPGDILGAAFWGVTAAVLAHAVFQLLQQLFAHRRKLAEAVASHIPATQPEPAVAPVRISSQP